MVVWRRELGVLAVNWADILDGEIVNAAWAVAGMAARPRTSRRAGASLDTAAWADTERLIRDALAGIAAGPDLPELTEDEAAELAAAVRKPEVQGALQALLAVRLTDAPETDAARAREAVRLALAPETSSAPGGASRDRRNPAAGEVPAAGGKSPVVIPVASQDSVTALFPDAPSRQASVRHAAQLSGYFDDKISALVATLEGRVGFAGLAQVRAEAYNARIVALLGAIERQVAALADAERGTQAEAQFLDRYQRQAHQRHGFLTPPDFDRRRRVPVADIYVPTAISEEDDAERTRLTPETPPSSLKVWDMAELDRTVLLGDPGGGKTTAANVLTDHFARDGSLKVAFLVTLREYAAKAPIEWSVTEHIEQNLKTLYQSPAPERLVERLLLTGRAVVIFDGLDELLDTSRRREVSDRVEQFCSAYPLAPVLVTSRVVGYDQARLDDSQFSCYRLGGFGGAEVAEYAGKWFRSQEGLVPAEAASKADVFLAESAHAKDLRANPLLLSLMCILYRGAGSLPGDRAGVYARCAELLLRKWDEQRDLYRKLGSDHLVEPTLRYLAWWLFTREDGQTTATERELIAKAAEFLHGRGYETEEQARAAAREFIEFCRGRMWVFSDAGTTADGEKLYGFTHRTFLEYFAAWHLSVTADSPEDLARNLAPRIASAGWGVVAELAIKIKSEASDRGTDRVYAALLDIPLSSSGREPLLGFLAALLPTARPAPAVVRSLTRAVLDYALSSAPKVYLGLAPLNALLVRGEDYSNLITEEMSGWIARQVASGEERCRAGALRLALSISIPLPGRELKEFWQARMQEQCRLYAAEIAAAAVDDGGIRILALYAGTMTPRDVLAMPGGLRVFLEVSPTIFQVNGDTTIYPPYFDNLVNTLLSKGFSTTESAFTAIGQHVLHQGEPPWIRTGRIRIPSYRATSSPGKIRLPALDRVGNLGIAVVLCILVEVEYEFGANVRWLNRQASKDGYARALLWYLTKRTEGAGSEFPDLPVPTEFKHVLREWAEGRVNFIEIINA